MNKWKILLEHWGMIIEVELKAKSYADAYAKAGTDYPQCLVLSIKQITSEFRKA